MSFCSDDKTYSLWSSIFSVTETRNGNSGIAGGVVGSLGLVAIILVTIFLLQKRYTCIISNAFYYFHNIFHEKFKERKIETVNEYFQQTVHVELFYKPKVMALCTILLLSISRIEEAKRVSIAWLRGIDNIGHHTRIAESNGVSYNISFMLVRWMHVDLRPILEYFTSI